MSNWFRVYGFADVQTDLLVGAYPLDGEDVEMLAWMRIERILNLVEDEEYDPGEREEVEAALVDAGIAEQRINLTDFGRLPPAKLEQAVGEVVDWLDQGYRVYVHCRAGWQRSAAVAAGVVALREGVGIQEALERVQERKASADPLPEQREDLKRWWDQRAPDTHSTDHADEPPGATGEEADATDQAGATDQADATDQAAATDQADEGA